MANSDGQKLIKQILGRQKYFSILFALTLTACNYSVDKFCGDAVGHDKIFIDSLNSKFGQIMTLRQMPCYPRFLQADLKTDVSVIILDSINVIRDKNGWVEFFVYDINGKLVRGNPGSL